ncbi:Imm74 family immunity protein [Amycolatopsis sp. NPDC049253]|uniref:Imm74 family immunity protein n=1 Tax=Amycolatopsis sp. NPDC049253 TaxID=3155274 RepID=UPI00342524B5
MGTTGAMAPKLSSRADITLKVGFTMITNITRGHIDLDVDGRTIRLQGEGFHRGPLDFLVITAQIMRWNDGAEVTGSERAAMLKDLRVRAAARGLVVEIE